LADALPCLHCSVTRRMLSLILFGTTEVISSLQLCIFKVDSNSSDALSIVSTLARSTIGSLVDSCSDDG
jgi:hypothetical protein